MESPNPAPLVKACSAGGHDDVHVAARRRHLRRRRHRAGRRGRRGCRRRHLLDQVRGREPHERRHEVPGARVPDGDARATLSTLAHLRRLLPRPHRRAHPIIDPPLAVDSGRGHRDGSNRSCAADADPAPRHRRRDRRARHLAGAVPTAPALVGRHIPALVDQRGPQPAPAAGPHRLLPRRDLGRPSTSSGGP